MKKHGSRSSWLLAAIVGAVVAPLASAYTPLTTTRVADGLARPVFVTAPPGDTGRIFIVEQRSGNVGRIRVLDLTTNPPTLLATPFLSVSPVSTGSEQGLLGLAFHPNYAANGYFYVNYTDAAGATVIRRYQANPPGNNVADAGSAYPILSLAQPFSNHNGGWIAFGPDGYLYVGMGDGGSAGDPGNRAQNLNDLLGKMLRIDVNADDFPADPNANYANPPTNPFYGPIAGRDEIWAYGLRNPWRNAFDRLTGDLYLADVGQNAWEEISFQPAASAGGANYGWRCYEGNQAYNTAGCPPPGTMVFPIHVYAHAAGRCSITGGYVYRGARIWDLRGTYFFADYCSREIWSFRYAGGSVTQFTNRTVELDPPGALTIDSPSSFGEDARGELYICDLGGEVFKIVPNGPVVGDLNNDGAINAFDIDAFVLAVTNPDAYRAQYGLEPNVVGDCNLDGVCNAFDIDAFVNLVTGGG